MVQTLHRHTFEKKNVIIWYSNKLKFSVFIDTTSEVELND